MKDFIIKLLDLKEKDIDSIDSITISDDSLNLIITLKRKEEICPRCGSFSHYIKDYKYKHLNHKVLVHSDTKIIYKQRRYICKDCHHTFYETCPFTSNRSSMTPATVISILDSLKPYTSTFSSVARSHNVSITTVVDIFDKHVQIRRKKLTEILCWDEFYFDRHSKKKYAFMMMDFKKKVILDIVESRWTEDLSAYFFSIPLDERNEVHFIIIDMYDAYRNLASIFFKNAKVCVDPFHCTKRINDSLNTIRKRVMRKYSEKKDSQEYKLLKNKHKVIFKAKDDLKDEYYYDRTIGQHVTEAKICEMILNIDADLMEAYKIKEEYLAINNVTENEYTGSNEKKAEFDSLIKRMILSEIKEMIECARTFKNWKEEILNSFRWVDERRLSNGPREGKNSYIKKIMHNENGFKNFKRARNKFMYSQNYHEKYTLSENREVIKQTGKTRGKYKKKKNKQ